MRQFFSELRPLLERVAVAGNQLAVMTPDMREGAEAVDLWLKDEIGMIEGLRDSEQAHGCGDQHNGGRDFRS